MATQETLNQSFEENVLKADGPVLVDFWAEWCGPCKRMHEYLDEVADELSDKIRITKVNIDEEMEIARRYNIMGVPALYLFKDGQVIAKKVGALSKEKLIEWIEETV